MNKCPLPKRLTGHSVSTLLERVGNELGLRDRFSYNPQHPVLDEIDEVFSFLPTDNGYWPYTSPKGGLLLLRLLRPPNDDYDVEMKRGIWAALSVDDT